MTAALAEPLLERVSLTGPDDQTALQDLHALSLAFPFVEWALLYVPHNEGVARNPTRDWRQAFFDAQLPGFSAVHLCGKQAFEQLQQHGVRYWPDMESGLRTLNRFDIGKAQQVLQAAARLRQPAG